VPIDIMNVYTGDVFTNNYLYAYCLKSELKLTNYSDFDRPKKKKIAMIASYNEKYFFQIIKDGENIDLWELRAKLALFGHSLGQVNIYGKGWPNSVSLEDSRFQVQSSDQFWGNRKMDILQQYHFNLCFENSTTNYYCSEKIWHSIITGCLPIYYGSGNAIYEDFPQKSFLDYCDFCSFQDLFEYINRMEIDEFNTRMNLCVEAANNVFYDNGYQKALSQLLRNTVSKIQTITNNKNSSDELIESIISKPSLSSCKNVALNKPAQQSSISKYSKPNDAQGAVSGIKSGRYNFHTDKEVNPWWQIDLERTYQVAEVIIYNRLDSCSERASSLKLFISLGGKISEQVYKNDVNKIFGGIDGNPLIVPLNKKEIRYVRIQLNAIEALHLDQVEVYAT
jgi:hypothetical protein